jgi:hypothetical protein
MELVYLHIIYLFTYVFTIQNIVWNKRIIVKKIGKKWNNNDPGLISEMIMTTAWSHWKNPRHS